MRVTKLIREYVEDAVAKRMPMPNEPEEVATLKAEWSALIEECERVCIERAAAFFIAHKGECAPYYHDDDLNDTQGILAYLQERTDVSFGSRTLTYASTIAHEKRKKEILKKRKEIVNDILLTLEMGGSKADLDAMLAEVGKDENIL